MDAYFIGVMTNVGLFSFLALSGYLLLIAGELSFGQQAFFGIGAYAAGIATAMYGAPLWMAIVRPMKSGRIVERRDQVLIGFLLPSACAFATLAARWMSMNGPFLTERGTAYSSLFFMRRRTIMESVRLLARVL